jgi:hypothetical protein
MTATTSPGLSRTLGASSEETISSLTLQALQSRILESWSATGACRSRRSWASAERGRDAEESGIESFGRWMQVRAEAK